MSPSAEGGSVGPARSLRTLVSVVAKCRACDFEGRSSRDASIHALVTGHEAVDVRTYVVTRTRRIHIINKQEDA